jgi:hypothetical protein
MTDQQLYLAIGIPMLFNAGLVAVMLAYIGSINKRIDDVRDVLRAEIKAETATLHGETSSLRAEMAKNHSELLAKLADMENRLDRRIEKLETGKWKA